MKETQEETVTTSVQEAAPAAAEPSTPVAAATSPSPVGDLPPRVKSLSPPDGWKATSRKGRGSGIVGPRPKQAQITNAAEAAKELQSASYHDDFGSKAPDPTPAAFALTNAAAWRQYWTAATLWQKYASEQRIAWESEAQAQMAALQPTFDYATSRDVAVAPKYGAVSRFYGATKSIAKRAANSRRKTAREERKAAAAQQPPAGTNGTTK